MYNAVLSQVFSDQICSMLSIFSICVTDSSPVMTGKKWDSVRLVKVRKLRNAQSTYLIVNQRRRSDIHELVYMLSVDFISYVSADVISTMSRDRLNSGQLIYVCWSGRAKVYLLEVSTYYICSCTLYQLY